MRINRIFGLSILFCVTVVHGSPLQSQLVEVNARRSVREIDWSFFSKTTTRAVTTTTVPPKRPNNLQIDQCEEDDKIIYVDDTKLEANNSTLGGVIEIHIDSPYYITCTKVFDMMPVGTGATPSFNSGGFGHKFVFINVQGQYGHGIHFKIIVRGILKMSENEIKSNVAGK